MLAGVYESMLAERWFCLVYEPHSDHSPKNAPWNDCMDFFLVRRGPCSDCTDAQRAEVDIWKLEKRMALVRSPPFSLFIAATFRMLKVGLLSFLLSFLIWLLDGFDIVHFSSTVFLNADVGSGRGQWWAQARYGWLIAPERSTWNVCVVQMMSNTRFLSLRL